MTDEKQEATFDMNNLWLWRGYSIGAYSRLEQALCQMFQALMGTTGNKAGIVFFKLHNARARNGILSDLLEDVYRDNFKVFWTSYFKLLGPLDNDRNSIVHWAAKTTFHADTGAVSSCLVQPNFWRNTMSPSINDVYMREFVAKCQIFEGLAAMFVFYVCHQQPEMDKAQVDAWLGIFRKSLVYPLPSGHPLYLLRGTQHTPQPSSQE